MPEEKRKSHWLSMLIVAAVFCLLGGLGWVNRPPAGFERLASTGAMFEAVDLAPTLGIEAHGCEESDGSYSADYYKQRMLCTWEMRTRSIDAGGRGILDPNATEVYILIMHRYQIQIR